MVGSGAEAAGRHTNRWVALLRGVNVGRSNRLSMDDLRATVTSVGFANVRTHIQSGNVLFDGGTDASGEAAIADRLTDAIARRHRLELVVVVRTVPELAAAAARDPFAASGVEAKLRHVLFLDRFPAATDALDPAVFDPDRWVVDGREVHVCYPNGSARSKLTLDVFERALGVRATARNLNTVRKLVELARSG